MFYLLDDCGVFGGSRFYRVRLCFFGIVCIVYVVFVFGMRVAWMLYLENKDLVDLLLFVWNVLYFRRVLESLSLVGFYCL